jgi:hypothetical protein
LSGIIHGRVERITGKSVKEGVGLPDVKNLESVLDLLWEIFDILAVLCRK